MINLVSNQSAASRVSGPSKVFRNLVAGLERISYPFVVNRDLYATQRLWIQDDAYAFQSVDCSRVHAVLGPNLFVMPDDMPRRSVFADALYVHPSPWAVDFWKVAGFDSCPLAAWPVGVDTDAFAPPDHRRSGSVLVYHKQRDPQDLVGIVRGLHALHLDVRLLLYGDYEESEYRRLLDGAAFVVWHGRAESQGLALEEALACDVPILVCDVTSVAQTRGGYPFSTATYDWPVTAAPYFDARCGEKITDLAALPAVARKMMDSLDEYSPREFVLERLSLEGQAREFVRLWEHWGLTEEGGRRERLRSTRRWRGRPLRRRVIDKMKSEVRRYAPPRST